MELFLTGGIYLALGVTALALGTAGALAGRIGSAETVAASPLVPGVASINHLHIEVSDVKRSAEFYSVVYGARPAAGTPTQQTMVLPSARPGFGSWMSLTTGVVDKAGKYDRNNGKHH